MTLLPYILGVTVGVFVMCGTMGAVFITLIVVLIKKKVQKKRLKVIVSKRIQNVYSEYPHMAAPIYEMVLGNFDHGADMNRTSVLNLAIDHDGSCPECTLSPTIDGISVPAHSEAMLVETSQEITSESVNINPHFQNNACPKHQHLNDDHCHTRHPNQSACPSVRSSISSHGSYDDFVYPSF